MPMVCIYVLVVKVRFQKRRIIFMSYILQWVIVQEVEGVEFMHLLQINSCLTSNPRLPDKATFMAKYLFLSSGEIVRHRFGLHFLDPI